MSTGGGPMAKKMKILESWSDLPVDMIILIVNHLCYVDQIRFRAVCRNWRAAGFVKYVDKLPWVMAYNADSCYLYDPSQKQTYTVFNNPNPMEGENKLFGYAKSVFNNPIPIKGLNKLFGNTKTVFNNPNPIKEENKLFGNAKALCSKYGWVLFFENTRRTTSFFFYSPFTSKIMKLVSPSYDPECLRSTAATFSKSPVSQDCVVFVSRIYARKYCISLCKVGDKTWTEFWFNDDYGWRSNVEYADGVFYCFFFTRKVIRTFDVELQKWELYTYPSIRPEENNGLASVFVDYLIVCDGNIFIALYVSFRWRVLKLDLSNLNLIEVKDYMNGRLLLLGNSSSMSISVGKESELSRIVHWGNRSCYFDCSCFPYCNLLPVSPLLCSQVYDVYTLGSKFRPVCPKVYAGSVMSHKFQRVWIQPPQLTE